MSLDNSGPTEAMLSADCGDMFLSSKQMLLEVGYNPVWEKNDMLLTVYIQIHSSILLEKIDEFRLRIGSLLGREILDVAGNNSLSNLQKEFAEKFDIATLNQQIMSKRANRKGGR